MALFPGSERNCSQRCREPSGRRLGRASACLWTATAVAALVFGSTPLRAQDAKGWVDKRVVPKMQSVKLRTGKKDVDPGEWGVLRVKEVNGRRVMLQVEGRGVQGWGMARDYVPLEQGVAFYSRYIRSNPEDPRGYAYRGLMRWLVDRNFGGALGDLNDAIALPMVQEDGGIRTWLLNCRGSVLCDGGRFDAAIDDFNLAIALEPQHVVNYIGRGYAWLGKKQLDDAFADFSRASRIDPKDARPYCDRAEVWAARKEFDKAIADCDTAIRLDPYYVWAFCKRGRARRSQQEYETAIIDFNQATRLDPYFALAYCERAWSWATCPDAKYRDGDRAVESASKACKLTEGKRPVPMAALAAAYAEKGDFDLAVTWQQKAQRFAKDDDEKEKLRRRLELYKNHEPCRDAEP
jgi:tetratricopeptide (TPR) repeat protein